MLNHTNNAPLFYTSWKGIKANAFRSLDSPARRAHDGMRRSFSERLFHHFDGINHPDQASKTLRMQQKIRQRIRPHSPLQRAIRHPYSFFPAPLSDLMSEVCHIMIALFPSFTLPIQSSFCVSDLVLSGIRPDLEAVLGQCSYDRDALCVRYRAPTALADGGLFV